MAPSGSFFSVFWIPFVEPSEDFILDLVAEDGAVFGLKFFAECIDERTSRNSMCFPEL